MQSYNPVNFTDPSGLFAIPFPIIPSLATLAKKVAAAIAATAAGAAATDYAIHGSNSAVGQAATGLSNTFGSITAPNPVVQNRATSIATSTTTTQARNQPIAISRPNNPSGTLIFRMGSGNATNMTPRPVDSTGLSFQLTRPTSGAFTVTTIEAVNATGVLRAVKDGPNHVSVVPTDPLMMLDWIQSRPNALKNPHFLTQVLMAITVRS